MTRVNEGQPCLQIDKLEFSSNFSLLANVLVA